MINYNNSNDESNYKTISEEDYGFIKEKLIKFLSEKSEGSLTDYILEFCYTNEYCIDDVADIIKKDNYLKTIIEMDCVNKKMFKRDIVKEVEW